MRRPRCPRRRRTREHGCDVSAQVRRGRDRRPVWRRSHQRRERDVTNAELPPQIRERTVAKARTLLEALPFMREHGGRVIVIKYGGAAMETGLASTFAEDVMLLQSVGTKPVIVPGGRPAVTQLSARLGI